jgi:glucose-6-phosphate dehydrogenase assembly protein OpcA
MVGIFDRFIVDSAEWDELRYGELAALFERTAVSDIAWARTAPWRVALAAQWPAIATQEVQIRGPRAEAALLRGWLIAQLDRGIRATEEAGEIGVELGGEELPAPRGLDRSPSDLLSAELDQFGPDRVYEAAVSAAT